MKGTFCFNLKLKVHKNKTQNQSKTEKSKMLIFSDYYFISGVTLAEMITSEVTRHAWEVLEENTYFPWKKAVILLIPRQKVFASKGSKDHGSVERNHIQENHICCQNVIES